MTEQATEKQLDYLKSLIEKAQFENDFYTEDRMNMAWIRRRIGKRLNRETTWAATVAWNESGRPLPETLSKKSASKAIDALTSGGLGLDKHLATIWAILHN